MSDFLASLLSFNPDEQSKPKTKRRFRELHWFSNVPYKFKAISSHWSFDEAYDNFPTKPGDYMLCSGHHNQYIIIQRVRIYPIPDDD